MSPDWSSGRHCYWKVRSKMNSRVAVSDRRFVLPCDARARVPLQSTTKTPGLENRQVGTLSALIPSRASFGSPGMRRLCRQFKRVAQGITFVRVHPGHTYQVGRQNSTIIVGTGCPQRSTVSYGRITGAALGLRYQLTPL
jgi:hypothetical protein